MAAGDKSSIQAIDTASQEIQQASNWTTRSADEVNAEEVAKARVNIKPSYEAGGEVYEATTQQTETFYRVSGPTNESGDWMVNFDPSQYSPEQLKDMLSLKYLPTQYSEVTIPPGTNLRVGTVAPIEGFGKGGAVQWQIVDGWQNVGANFKYINGLTK